MKKEVKTIIAFVLLFILGCVNFNEPLQKSVREPVVAGTWYPGDKETLTKTVDDYFANAKKLDIDNIKALIVPHAGYTYSGQVAAQGFAQLKKNYKKVIIIGTNHVSGVNIQGISVPLVTHYKTPLGEIKVSRITSELLKNDLFVNAPEAHTAHMIEIELPFLQTKLKNFEIIPLVTGGLNLQQIQQAADILSNYLDEDMLIVVSSDLSHYHPYDEAVQLDKRCISSIESINFEETAKCEACSLYAILILMELAKRNNWNAKIIDYKNSGDVTGDNSGVVGYSSIIFYEQDELTEKEKGILLEIARKKLESIYNGKEPSINEAELTPNLKKVQGCFTTLNKNGALRGCIGHILPREEIYNCVLDNIVNAALHDSRFNPVTKDELKDIEIEISVLTVPEKLEYTSPIELLGLLRPKVDGVIIDYNNRQSTYLPQVWEQLPDKQQFLSQLCIKQGSIADCWKDPYVQVYIYNALVFHE